MNGKRLCYLDTGATSLKPKSVIKSLAEHLEKHASNVHRGIYRISEENTTAFEQVRNLVKNFIGANSTKEIIFTKGTTESINLVAHSFSEQYLSDGDLVLITEMEHHSNIVPWQLVAKKKNLKIKVVPINDQGELILDEYQTLLKERPKLVAFTAVSNTLGTINPIHEIVAMAKKSGAYTLIDAAQALPHYKLNVADLGVDFLAFSAHKFYGPTGLGVLYGREELLEKMPPYQGGGNMIASVSFLETTFNELPEKFEAGTPAIAEVIAFGKAIDFFNSIGHSRAREIDHHLKLECEDMLKSFKDITIFGEAKKKVAIFSFGIKGAHPHDIGQILDKEGIAVRTGHHCTQPLMKRFGVTHMVRASFGIYNNSEDIKQFKQGLQKVRDFLL